MRQDLQKVLAERDAQLEKRDGTDDQLREELEISQRDATARAEALARAEAQLKSMTEENKEQAERLTQAQITMESNTHHKDTVYFDSTISSHQILRWCRTTFVLQQKLDHHRFESCSKHHSDGGSCREMHRTLCCLP